MAVIASTTPTGSPSSSRIGPCSMCSSIHVSRSSRLASGIRSGSRPTAAHRLADRHALAVADPFRLVRRDRADDRARAPEVGRVETARLLLAQRHRLERAARRAELLAQGPERDERGDDAERAVVAAAGGLRVDVRPGCDHRAALAPGERPPHVADRVARTSSPASAHPGGDLVLGGDPLGRVRGAPDPGLSVRAVARELEQEPLDETRVDVDQVGAFGGMLLVVRVRWASAMQGRRESRY